MASSLNHSDSTKYSVIKVAYPDDDDLVSISLPLEGEARYVRQSSCPSHYAVVKYVIEPFESEHPIVFENRATLHPRHDPEAFNDPFHRFINAFQEGIQEAFGSLYENDELRIGRIKIIVLELYIHEYDSREISYKMAAYIMITCTFRKIHIPWEFIMSGSSGDALTLKGVDLWQCNWKDTGRKANVTDPMYMKTNAFTIWQVIINGEIVEFAAGEFSNDVWGFYIQV